MISYCYGDSESESLLISRLIIAGVEKLLEPWKRSQNEDIKADYEAYKISFSNVVNLKETGKKVFRFQFELLKEENKQLSSENKKLEEEV